MTMPARMLEIRELPGHPRLGIQARAHRDVGTLITASASAELIAGVEIALGQLWSDDRGFFTELFRLGDDGLTHGFAAPAQISAALSYAGAIKAFHFHRRQTDLWAPVRGQFQMVLCDLRRESSTFGCVNTVHGGEWRPWRLRIPPGVAHGYKVVGTEPGLMVYATDRYYDPSDEGRIPFDDAGLNYAWETQHK